ncbi:MAG: putative tricarboxylic transport membrane protein [Candidatus Azotimanducaceae bacterium]|jgi:putative tricarboxylic transport membrane protein
MNSTNEIEKTDRPRKPGELIFAYLLFAASIGISYFAFTISGLPSMSSPGIIPMLAAIFLTVSSLITLIRTQNMPATSEGASFSALITPKLFLFFTSITFVYILIIDQFGFIASSILFLFFSMLALHRKGPLLAMLLSVNVLAIIYVVFRVVFKVILPEANVWE